MKTNNELESDIEKRLVTGIRKLGGRAYKFVSPGNAGVPDRIVILPHGVIWFVELKRSKGVLSKKQLAQHALLNRLGQNVITLYGRQDVDRFIEQMKGGDADDIQATLISD